MCTSKYDELVMLLVQAGDLLQVFSGYYLHIVLVR